MIGSGKILTVRLPEGTDVARLRGQLSRGVKLVDNEDGTWDFRLDATEVVVDVCNLISSLGAEVVHDVSPCSSD